MIARGLCLVAVALLLQACNLETIVSPTALPETENLVYTDDGRLYVAGKTGIHEVSATATRPSCLKDAAGQRYYCEITPPPVLNGSACFFTGMTTDGVDLYAACTLFAGSATADPAAASLVRVTGLGGEQPEIERHDFAEPSWLNGMTVLARADDGVSILATQSVSGTAHQGVGDAIVKLDISDDMQVAVSPWLAANGSFYMPNGIERAGDTIYFVGGQNLYAVALTPALTAGEQTLLYQAGFSKLLDDIAVNGDYVAVAEIPISNFGAGRQVVSVSLAGGQTQVLDTGNIGLSDLVLAPSNGVFGEGNVLASSYFNGGVYRVIFPTP